MTSCILINYISLHWSKGKTNQGHLLLFLGPGQHTLPPTDEDIRVEAWVTVLVMSQCEGGTRFSGHAPSSAPLGEALQSHPVQWTLAMTSTHPIISSHLTVVRQPVSTTHPWGEGPGGEWGSKAGWSWGTEWLAMNPMGKITLKIKIARQQNHHYTFIKLLSSWPSCPSKKLSWKHF